MKKIYKLSYLNNSCLFFNSYFAEDTPLLIEELTRRNYKKQKLTKYIKNKLMSFTPKDWKTYFLTFEQMGMKNEVLKEFFPIKYQWVIDNFREANVCDYGYRSSDNKIVWKVVESDKVFLKNLTDSEFKAHTKNLCNKFIEKFNKEYMQFGGYFLIEKENLITDKNISNGKYKTYDYNPSDWIII